MNLIFHIGFEGLAMLFLLGALCLGGSSDPRHRRNGK
jgi:hypothetical protein